MSPVKMEKIERSLRIVVQFIELINQNDSEGIQKIVSDDCIYEGFSPDDACIIGKEKIALKIAEYRARLDNFHIEPEEIYNMGLQCVIRFKIIWNDSPNTQKTVRCLGLFQVRNMLLANILLYSKRDIF